MKQLFSQFLELLKFKNRQMEMPTFTLMKDQAVTRAIQMFPPFLSQPFKPRRTRRPAVLRGQAIKINRFGGNI